MAAIKVVFSLLFLLVAVAQSNLFSSHWTNSWVVHLKDDMSEKAVDVLAERHGFKNRKQISILPRTYHFELVGGDSDEHSEKTKQLLQDSEVESAYQEKTKPFMVPKFKPHHRRF